MEGDTVLTILFGSGIIGSIVITWYQSRLQRMSEINRNLEMIYLDQGIDAVNNDVSRYGLTCTTTIHYIMRNFDSHINDVKGFLNNVAERKLVGDLVGYNYSSATPSLYKLYFFDKELRLYNCIVNVLFTWSLFTQDITDYEKAQELFKDPHWKESAKGTANLAQDMMMYLTSRLVYLSHWIREKNYCSFIDLKKDIVVEKKIEPLLNEMKEFYDIWKEWMDSQGPVDRPKKSQKLHDWVSSKLKEPPSMNDC